MRSLRGNNFGFKALNRLLGGGGGGGGPPKNLGGGVGGGVWGGGGYTSKIWVGSLQMWFSLPYNSPLTKQKI